MALIPEPTRPNPLIRLGTWISERVTGKRMEPARLLAWYPRAALSSGILESLVAHREPSGRLLKLVRITASVTATCPFCIDMNGAGYDREGLTDEEVAAVLAGEPGRVDSFDRRELLAVEYARRVSSTPLMFPASFADELREAFTEREIVILATTAAQVNYWARTIQALGIPPAGFSDSCRTPSPAG